MSEDFDIQGDFDLDDDFDEELAEFDEFDDELENVAVRTAVTAESGLAEASEHRPDAIILDLRMPLVDGLGFLKRLRATEGVRETPVAIVTGDYFLDEQVSAELQQLGAELKFKPLWLEDLVALARTLLKVTP